MPGSFGPGPSGTRSSSATKVMLRAPDPRSTPGLIGRGHHPGSGRRAVSRGRRGRPAVQPPGAPERGVPPCYRSAADAGACSSTPSPAVPRSAGMCVNPAQARLSVGDTRRRRGDRAVASAGGESRVRPGSSCRCPDRGACPRALGHEFSAAGILDQELTGRCAMIRPRAGRLPPSCATSCTSGGARSHRSAVDARLVHSAHIRDHQVSPRRSPRSSPPFLAGHAASGWRAPAPPTIRTPGRP